MQVAKRFNVLHGMFPLFQQKKCRELHGMVAREPYIRGSLFCFMTRVATFDALVASTDNDQPCLKFYRRAALLFGIMSLLVNIKGRAECCLA